MKNVGLKEYVKEILKSAEYKKDNEIDCVVAPLDALDLRHPQLFATLG